MSAPAYTNDQGGRPPALHLGWKEYIKWRITVGQCAAQTVWFGSTKYGGGYPVMICQTFYAICGQMVILIDGKQLFYHTYTNLCSKKPPFKDPKLNMLHFPAVLLDKWSSLVKSQQRRFRKYKSLGGALNILQRGLYQLINPNKSSS